MKIAEGNNGKDTTVRLIQESHNQDNQLYIYNSGSNYQETKLKTSKLKLLKNQLGWVQGIQNAPPFSPNQDLFLPIQIPTQRGDKDNPSQI